MVERIKKSLDNIIKIELTGNKNPFVVYKGTHPDPGSEGYPWERSQEELLENRISVFSGLNRSADPKQKWREHYLLEDTNHEKLCDLMQFFDFGMDHFKEPSSGRLLNSNQEKKVAQRREAAQKFLRHFRQTRISILSLTSDHLIFAVSVDESKSAELQFLADAAWNHNNIYYPRPRNITSTNQQYSQGQAQQLAADYSVFSIGWDDA